MCIRDSLSELAGPCSTPDQACDMDDGCIGAVIGYVESRLDLSQFDEMPSQDYIAGCIAPFALSDEVTDTIPQETLGAMIGCDYDAIAKRFEDSYNAQRAAALEGDSADADADADDTDPIE